MIVEAALPTRSDDDPVRDLFMCNKLFAASVLLAAGGCRMCSDSCDYSPPVAGSPYNGFTQRAGSAFNGEVTVTTPPVPATPPDQSAPSPIQPTFAP